MPSPASTLKSEGFSGTAKISFLDLALGREVDKHCSHSAANTVIVSSRLFLIGAKFNGELEGATVAVNIVGFAFLHFLPSSEYIWKVFFI